MNRQLLSTLFLVIVMAASVHASNLNILTDYENARVYLNKRFIGTGPTQIEDLEPGDYLVELQLNGDKIYSKMVNLDGYGNKVLNTGRFVDVAPSKLPDKGPRKLEEKRLDELKGEFGVGLVIGKTHGGVSGRYRGFRPMILQGLGWTTRQDIDGSHSYSLAGRALYKLSDRLTGPDLLSSLYVGVGYAIVEKDDRADNSSSVGLNEVRKTKDHFTEYILGIEVPLQHGGYVNFDVIWHNGLRTFTTWGDSDRSESNHGLDYAIGFHYYF